MINNNRNIENDINHEKIHSMTEECIFKCHNNMQEESLSSYDIFNINEEIKFCITNFVICPLQVFNEIIRFYYKDLYDMNEQIKRNSPEENL